MARLVFPPLVKEEAGADAVEVEGSTLGEVLDSLRRWRPEIAERLADGERFAANLTVVIDGVIVPRDAATEVGPGSEIHLLPAIGGGSDD